MLAFTGPVTDLEDGPDAGNRQQGPPWLIWLGALLLLAILLFAAFSLGVYMGERDMTRAVAPPWPEPRPTVTPATIDGGQWTINRGYAIPDYRLPAWPRS
jgi:hypothetical protein